MKPATTSIDAGITIVWTMRVVLCAGGVAIKNVPDPFPDVAGHIVQIQLVRFFTADGLGSDRSVVHEMPGNFVDIVASAVDIAVGVVAAASSEFPFRFGGKPVPLAVQEQLTLV